MKSIANRTCFALVLACILLFGVLTFAIRYFLYAERWVSFTGSPHVYTKGRLDTGEIVDRSGEVLYSSTAKQLYADSAQTRKATLHLMGDRAGNIPPRILRAYASKLFGYDKLNGTAAMEMSGGELRLTVSAQVQTIAQQAMNGRKGAVGVYNYRTGEILCAFSSPTFDPLDPPDLKKDNKDGRYDGVYIYRFFHAAYTPGSIFKLTTLAAALDEDPDIADETFTCTGARIINGERITCPKAHGEETLREALANSCNCAFSEIARMFSSLRPASMQSSLSAETSKSAQSRGIMARSGSARPHSQRLTACGETDSSSASASCVRFCACLHCLMTSPMFMFPSSEKSSAAAAVLRLYPYYTADPAPCPPPAARIFRNFKLNRVDFIFPSDAQTLEKRTGI